MKVNHCIDCSKPISNSHHAKRCHQCANAARSEDKHPLWKGDKVSYQALHKWIRRHLPKPSLCQRCQKTPPRDVSNNGVYSRDLTQWEWLCPKCHKTKDGPTPGFKGKHHSEKTKNKWKQTRKGTNTSFFGKHHTTASKMQISASEKATKRRRRVTPLSVIL